MVRPELLPPCGLDLPAGGCGGQGAPFGGYSPVQARLTTAGGGTQEDGWSPREVGGAAG